MISFSTYSNYNKTKEKDSVDLLDNLLADIPTIQHLSTEDKILKINDGIKEDLKKYDSVINIIFGFLILIIPLTTVKFFSTEIITSSNLIFVGLLSIISFLAVFIYIYVLPKGSNKYKLKIISIFIPVYYFSIFLSWHYNWNFTIIFLINTIITLIVMQNKTDKILYSYREFMFIFISSIFILFLTFIFLFLGDSILVLLDKIYISNTLTLLCEHEVSYNSMHTYITYIIIFVVMFIIFTHNTYLTYLLTVKNDLAKVTQESNGIIDVKERHEDNWGIE